MRLLLAGLWSHGSRWLEIHMQYHLLHRRIATSCVRPLPVHLAVVYRACRESIRRRNRRAAQQTVKPGSGVPITPRSNTTVAVMRSAGNPGKGTLVALSHPAPACRASDRRVKGVSSCLDAAQLHARECGRRRVHAFRKTRHTSLAHFLRAAHNLPMVTDVQRPARPGPRGTRR